MEKLTPEEKAKLLASADIVDKGSFAIIKKIYDFQLLMDRFVSEEKDILAIIPQLDDLKSLLDSSVSNMEDGVQVHFEETKYLLNDLELSLKDQINSSERTSLGQIKELSTRISNEIKKVVASIPVKPDLKYLEDRINEVESMIPIIPEFPKIPEVVPLSGGEIVDKINALPTDNNGDKIGMDHILFLREEFAKLNYLIANTTRRVGGGTTQATSGTSSGGGHTIQDEGISLPAQTKLNFIGAGVSATNNGATGATDVTISGATVTFVINELLGTGDDSTTAFVLAFTPSAGTVAVYVGGLRQTLTTDYSISGTTVTFVNAPPFGMKIIADYQR